MKPHEIQEKLGLTRIRDRNWYVQPSCATTGDGLYEGLTWLTSNHKSWFEKKYLKKKREKKNSFLIVLTLGDKSLLYICGYCQSKPYPRSRQQLASFFGKAGFVHLVDLFCRFFFFSSNINEATSHVTFPEIGNFVLFFKSTPFCVIYFALVMCSSFIQKYPQIKLYLFTLLICLFFFRFFFLEES